MSDSLSTSVAALRERLAAAGQEHVLAFYSELEAAAQEKFLSTLSGINIEQIAPDFKRAMAGKPPRVGRGRVRGVCGA
jgi:hypothetical protein